MTAPTFSIVLPVFRTEPRLLIEQLGRIRAQTYPLWECIVVDDGSADGTAAIVDRWAAGDRRWHVRHRPANGGIAAATNDALDVAGGDFVAFADHDDLLAFDALAAFAAEIRRHPDTDVIYSDERMIDGRGVTLHDYRKPDWSPERLLGQMYVNHLTAIRRTLLAGEPLRSDAEPTQDYDLLLRVVPRARRISHVPQRLYSWRAVAGSIALALREKRDVGAAVQRAVAAALHRAGDGATLAPVEADPTCVSVIRPVRAGVSWAAIDITDLDATAIDAAVRAATADAVTLWRGEARARRIVGAGAWHDPLLGQVTRPGVGAAGPRLVTADGRLVSAGRIHQPAIRDLHAGGPASDPGPWGCFQIAREVAGVAPLGLTVRRDDFVEAGGLAALDDLDVAVALLCSRLQAAGRLTVWTPQCEIVLPASWTLPDGDALARRDAVATAVLLAEPAVFDDAYTPVGVP